MTIDPLDPRFAPMAISGTYDLNSPALNLVVELTRYSQERYTGKLEIQVQSGQTWSLYLQLGRLSWVTGGEHPRRRWQRHFERCFPEINPNQFNFNCRRSDEGEDRSYPIFANNLSV
ncbi:MAG: hypothetical protein SAJ12_05370 [Jaaginema sp. PMC 1079.18]|nr:hypothetical protein [Jaaginema sp. PMC 1080.18]MEC4850421.1 hypothetical protein [Jaaginema sp. PMC 1079.18]MEC4866558.1 hypothetical protein [Jaaginema sp. PMC 1078.18]